MNSERHPMWKDIDSKMYTRLCECRSLQSDIPILAKSVYHYMKSTKYPEYTAKDALAYMFDHIESNSQGYLIDDIDMDTYNEWVADISA